MRTRFKTEHIDLHLAGASPDAHGGRGSAATGTVRRYSAPPKHDERRIVAFPAHAISTRKAPSRENWDANRGSNVVDFRRHRTSPSKAAGRFNEASVGRPEASHQGDEDHRHRMFMNLLAAAASVLLIIAGDWMFSTLAKIP
jgi:hypothetical protein